MNAITKAMTNVAKTVKVFYKKNQADILLGAGLVGMGAGIALTIVGTLRSRKEYDVLLDKECMICDEIHDDKVNPDGDLTEDEAGREIISCRIRFGIKSLINYAPAIAATTAGVVCIVASRNIRARQFAALAAGYNTLLATYNEYRQRVIADHGEEYDRKTVDDILEMRRQIDTEKDLDGKTLTDEQALKALGIDPMQDCSSILFDENTSCMFQKAGVYNADFLKITQDWAKNKLHADGYLLKSDVLKQLGIDPVEYPLSFVTGWVYDGMVGSDIVDFGLWTDANEDNWGDSAPNGWWLHFNDHGVILPYLELVRRSA